jgi:eukaryotic-like serine/threonine-protein kinase
MLTELLLVSILGADPAMFRGGPTHSGVYEDSAGIRTVVWKYRTSAKVLSSPAVADGVVYVGSSDHNLYAIAAADGALRWKFPTNGPVTSSPAVAGGAVYFTSVDGNLYAVGAADGKLRWKFRTEGERRFTPLGIHGAIPHTELMPDPYDVFLSSPAVVGGTVYSGSGDHNVYAVVPEQAESVAHIGCEVAHARSNDTGTAEVAVYLPRMDSDEHG